MPRATTLGFSIAIHSVAVLAVFAMALGATRLPTDPPRQTELYRPVAEPPEPPPAPRGVRRTAAAPAVEKQQAFAEAPELPSEAAHFSAPAGGLKPAAALAVGEPDGIEGGVQGGEPGGTGATVGAVQHGPYTPGVGGVTLPRVIERVEPRFPERWRRAITNATVVVQCVIGIDGRVRDPQIVTSSFPPFNDAVVDALSHWKFEPGKMHGEPVDTIFVLTVKFEVR